MSDADCPAADIANYSTSPLGDIAASRPGDDDSAGVDASLDEEIFAAL